MRVIRADKLHALDRCFDCPIESVVVPPKTAANLSLRFKPQLPAVRSVESFLVELGGGLCGAVRLQCCGESSAPRVQLSVRNINFYRLDVGQTASQPIELENHSDCAQPFQFQCDNQVRSSENSNIGFLNYSRCASECYCCKNESRAQLFYYLKEKCKNERHESTIFFWRFRLRSSR